MYTERQEYTLMGVSTTVGCRKLTSYWSSMCGGQKLQTYIYYVCGRNFNNFELVAWIVMSSIGVNLVYKVVQIPVLKVARDNLWR